MTDCLNYALANIACIVFFGIIIFTLERGVDKQVSTILLIRIMQLLVGYFASDAIWVLFECGVFKSGKTTMYIVTIIPYICLLITAWLWFIYCETIQGNTKILVPPRAVLGVIPFLIAIIILIIGIFTDYLFAIDETGYLPDTHTAVALHCAREYRQKESAGAPLVVLSTASPFKFPSAVLTALGETPSGDAFAQMAQLSLRTGLAVPVSLSGLQELPVLHRDVIDKADIAEYVRGKLAVL